MKPLASRTDALRQSDIRAVTFAVNAVDGINQAVYLKRVGGL